MKKIMPRIIGHEQSGFVAGRDIRDNVLEALIMLQVANKSPGEIKGAFIFLDFEIAYERMDRDFLLQVMRKMGFPPQFCWMIHTLVKDSSARVFINGNISAMLIVASGARQGCPSAPWMFAIYAEPLRLVV